MPRLVLFEDDGTELFSGDVSRAVVQWLALMLRQNRGVVQAAAVTARVVRAALGGPPPPRAVGPVPRRRQARRGRA